jgi:DNA-binding IclR family transcriptional regulator
MPTDQRTNTAKQYQAPALEKGLDILEVLAGSASAMNLSQISQALGRERGEVFRVLRVLERRGYLERAPDDDRYIVTNRLFVLGMERPAIKELLEAALPMMHSLSDSAQLSCHLVVASDEFMVVIARVRSPNELGLIVKVGLRRLLLEATSGLVLLAFQPETVRASWVQKYAATIRRQNQPAMLEAVEAIRAQGYAAIPSVAVPPVIDISAPILRRSAAVAALTVPYLKLSGVRVSQSQVIKTLRATAKEISAKLG